MELDMEPETAELGGYRHFMEKEEISSSRMP